MSTLQYTGVVFQHIIQQNHKLAYSIIFILRTFQLLLFPLSLLYQGILRLRNHLYDIDFIGSTQFDIPTINIGNLAFGGTGKTPHIEYLIKLLSTHSMQVSVLSRGYKIKTIGYLFADKNATPFTLGDEPYQLFCKFPQASVAVSENRVLGIPNLLFDAPNTEVILLDDAYQHRALKAGLNILLTEQDRLYCDDFLVPSGYLREYASASNRANIIIVSKCKPNLSSEAKNNIIQKLKPLAHQKVFFSHLVYGEIVPYFTHQITIKAQAVLGVCGIARPVLFQNHLQEKYSQVQFKSFPDHHLFTEKDIDWIVYEYEQIKIENKIIITTEKDYQKLLQSAFIEKISPLPLYYLPIEIAFSSSDENAFNDTILQYVYANPRKY